MNLGLLEERVGFEPTVPCGTTVFKTAAFDHSATSPQVKECFYIIEILYKKSNK